MRPQQHIAIRVDASNEIGTGHVMRCLTLADGLSQQGAQVSFICRYLPDYLADTLKEKGHRLHMLKHNFHTQTAGDLAHAHWLDASQQSDATECIQLLGHQQWDWLIVDHYALDARWELALRTIVKKIMVIDDLADRQHECDVLLDQNFYNDQDHRYKFRVPSTCKLLLGPSYALLRQAFGELHSQSKPREGIVKRILVFFGGVDADNYTSRALNTLINLNLKNIDVDVVIGSLHAERSSIEAVCKAHGFSLHVQTIHMAKLMTAADFSIGAGGSATWERCCLGLPTLTACTAVNQAQQLIDAAAEGLLFFPPGDESYEALLSKHIPALIENEYMRRTVSRNALHAVDGQGVSRITNMLRANDIEMRVATADDSSQLFEWRNHPSIRKVSRNTAAIPWEMHQAWFAEVLASTSRVLLIGSLQAMTVGVVRFDFHDNQAEVSIYLVPDSQVRGLGRTLLLSAEQWIVRFHPETHSVYAHVLGENEPSHRLFSRTNYQVESTCYIKRLH